MQISLYFKNFLSKKKLTLDFATKSPSNDKAIKTYKDKLKELQKRKHNFPEIFKHNIETMMLEHVQTLGITYEIKSAMRVKLGLVKKCHN